jgi:capsular polysaccharide biosynthesis protein
MTQSTSDPIAAYWWAVRHYRWLVAALAALALAFAGILIAREQSAPPQYEATALVIANELAHSPEQLPRLAETLLAKDSVAEDAIEAGGLPWTPRELREEHVELTPLEQNVLIEVTGRTTEPELAAQTANSVADALAEALNRPGSGVGVFSIQHRASPPTEPADDKTLALLLVGGLALAVLLPLGAVGLLFGTRLPMTRADDAADAADTRVLGVVGLPPRQRTSHLRIARRASRQTLAASDLPGLGALCQTLFPDGKGTRLLSAPAGTGGVRTEVASWLVGAMAEQGDVAVVPAWGVEADGIHERVLVLERPIVDVPDNVPVVIDGFDNDGIAARQTMPEGALGVLVVPEGTPRTRVIDAAEQFASGELAGVVFVRR